jgi:hypothetical protein
VGDPHRRRKPAQRVSCCQAPTLRKGEPGIGPAANEAKQLDHLVDLDCIAAQCQSLIPFNLSHYSGVHPQTLGDEILFELHDSLGALLIDRSYSLQ